MDLIYFAYRHIVFQHHSLTRLLLWFGQCMIWIHVNTMRLSIVISGSSIVFHCICLLWKFCAGLVNMVLQHKLRSGIVKPSAFLICWGMFWLFRVFCDSIWILEFNFFIYSWEQVHNLFISNPSSYSFSSNSSLPKFIYLFLTHWVSWVIPVCAWVWDNSIFEK